MMMPANYSVIAENEMTYVNGGASFIDAIGAVTAPIWNLDNVKAFSTNIVTLIGNNFITGTIQNTLGYVFSGHATKAGLGDSFGKVVGADKFKAGQYRRRHRSDPGLRCCYLQPGPHRGQEHRWRCEAVQERAFC